jgi:polyhydroxybutyrate depolymerase
VTARRAVVVAATVALAAALSNNAALANGGRGGGEPSPGCAQPHAGGTTIEALPFANGTREYRLAVPPDYTGKKPLPLVLNYHGLGSNSVQQAVYSQLEQKGPAQGFVVATPQGTGNQAFWNILPRLPQPDDVGLANALIDHLEGVLCIDPKRVFATGISNGAGMSVYLGCKLQDRLAGIAPVAGVNLVAPCTNGKPLSVFAFHGTADPSCRTTAGHRVRGRFAARRCCRCTTAWRTGQGAMAARRSRKRIR